MPSPSDLTLMARKVSTAIGPNQRRPRVRVDRSPREQAAHGSATELFRGKEGVTEALTYVSRVNKQLVTSHGCETGGIGR